MYIKIKWLKVHFTSSTRIQNLEYTKSVNNVKVRGNHDMLEMFFLPVKIYFTVDSKLILLLYIFNISFVNRKTIK